MAKLTTLLRENETRTEKQVLVDMKNAGHISGDTLKGLAQALDILRAQNVPNALRVVCTEFDAGNLTVGSRSIRSAEPKRLEDAPAHYTEKEKLRWLRDAGRITTLELKQAARALDGGAAIEEALTGIGAAEATEKKPEPPPPTDGPLDGTKFASPAAQKLALENDMRDADFDGVDPSGKSGYTVEDVKARIEALFEEVTEDDDELDKDMIVDPDAPPAEGTVPSEDGAGGEPDDTQETE